ncbi:MAG: CYTH domain-containing protein [Coriobacteriia bacterium]|nr:CYTH domain-containing protein [Coriobacteriia bacterium]
MKEIEIKRALSSSAYLQLRKYFEESNYSTSGRIQKNYYFDSDNFQLLREDVTCRLRVVNCNQFEFTIKVKLPASREGLKMKYETNRSINKQLFKHIISKELLPESLYQELQDAVQESFNLPQIDQIKLQGFLETERTKVPLCETPFTIELDKSLYFDKIDYELEMEIESEDRISEGEDYLINLFDELNIAQEVSPSTSKTARFAEEHARISSEG